MNSHKPYRLVIFDWDGTLMDSVGRIVSSMQAAAKDCQWPVPDECRVREIIGLSLKVAIPILFGERTEAEIELLIGRYREHYLFLDKTPTTLFTGVKEVLAALKDQGYLLAVATGKARAGLDRVLKETSVTHLFEATRAADEANSKPDPLMLEQILEQLSVPVGQALMIGDSIHDMEMARRLGMDRIGITWGSHDASALQAYAPCQVFDDLGQLLAWLPSATVPVAG